MPELNILENKPVSTAPNLELIKLTEVAATKVQEIRVQDDDIGDDLFLRLGVLGGGCSGFSYELVFDEKTELDREFDVRGIKVVVDEMSLMYLVGTEVDYLEELSQAGFKFHNPNVSNTCGCGSSFS